MMTPLDWLLLIVAGLLWVVILGICLREGKG